MLLVWDIIFEFVFVEWLKDVVEGDGWLFVVVWWGCENCSDFVVFNVIDIEIGFVVLV